jgi:hypothetical protein
MLLSILNNKLDSFIIYIKALEAPQAQSNNDKDSPSLKKIVTLQISNTLYGSKLGLLVFGLMRKMVWKKVFLFLMTKQKK